MNASPILRTLEGGRLAFWCPGCEETHHVTVGPGPGPRWGYNGRLAAPTLTPSVLVRSGHHVPGHVGECWCTWAAEDAESPGFSCSICHSFVTDGRIRFLPDSTHALSGQTVDLPAFPD